jgi:hypothetical protein
MVYDEKLTMIKFIRICWKTQKKIASFSYPVLIKCVKSKFKIYSEHFFF